jgi:hypothetical protein
MTNQQEQPSWYTDMFDAGGRRKYPTRPTNPQNFQQTNPNTRQATGLASAGHDPVLQRWGAISTHWQARRVAGDGVENAGRAGRYQ